MFANALGFACYLEWKLRLRDGPKFNVQKYIDFSIDFFSERLDYKRLSPWR